MHQVPTTSAGEGQTVLLPPPWCITGSLLAAGGQTPEVEPTTFAYHISHSISATAVAINATKTYMELNMSCGMALHILIYTTTMFHALYAP